MDDDPGLVYLLHFDRPFGHARHYCGWATNETSLERRLWHHAQGSGSKLCRAVKLAGIGWVVARKWPADRHFERKLKNRGSLARVCPICIAEQPMLARHRGSMGTLTVAVLGGMGSARAEEDGDSSSASRCQGFLE